MFIAYVISVILVLRGKHANGLANVVSTYMRPPWLLVALYENRI
jgi:hypothetical protein